MIDSSNALLAAVRSRLLADLVIAAAVADRVVDEPAQTIAFDYIQLGDTQVIPFDFMCGSGVQVFFDLHVWCREDWAGDRMRDICSAIYTSLHRQKFLIVGHDLQLLEHQTTRTLRDPDGLTRHAVVSFRADTTAA
jgi:Protein of unknown function (DUF3168)